jgi:hypothetical protein
MLNERHTRLIVTYEVSALRTLPEWNWVKGRLRMLRETCRDAAIFVQDDYTMPAAIDDLAVEMQFDTIFSPLAEFSEVFFPRAVQRGVQVVKTLTGYVHPRRAALQQTLAPPLHRRPVDLAQRISLVGARYGHGALAKSEFSSTLASAAMAEGFNVDVQAATTKPLLGETWWAFLRDARYVPGALGGATTADLFGKVSRRESRIALTSALGLPRTMSRSRGRSTVHGAFRAIGPRLFEAAMTRTCQVLLEASYLPELEPNQHYIPANETRDSIVTVLQRMRDVDRSQEMVESAWQAIVAPRTYHYPTAVRGWLTVLGLSPAGAQSSGYVIDEQESLQAFLSLSPRRRLELRERLVFSMPPWPRLRRTSRRRLGTQESAFLRAVSLVQGAHGEGRDLLAHHRPAVRIDPEMLIWPWISPLASPNWLDSIVHGSALERRTPIRDPG